MSATPGPGSKHRDTPEGHALIDEWLDRFRIYVFAAGIGWRPLSTMEPGAPPSDPEPAA